MNRCREPPAQQAGKGQQQRRRRRSLDVNHCVEVASTSPAQLERVRGRSQSCWGSSRPWWGGRSIDIREGMSSDCFTLSSCGSLDSSAGNRPSSAQSTPAAVAQLDDGSFREPSSATASLAQIGRGGDSLHGACKSSFLGWHNVV